MTLVLFDLDNTLLTGDSDHEWGNFLIKKNLVDEASYRATNEAFYAQYKLGILDIYEYSSFSFSALAAHSMDELKTLHAEFMESVIQPMIGKKAKDLVDSHRIQGHTLVVITATNSFITRPIIEEFGITHLIATEPKLVNGRFTNEIEGTPCYQEGKVIRLEQWIDKKQSTFDGSIFYSDSINDLPLMEKVDIAIAVDPDDKLRSVAIENDWEIISLRP